MPGLEQAPEDAEEFDSQSIDLARIDPFYHSTDAKTPSPVWEKSQALRKVLDQQGSPASDDRAELMNSVLRQLPSLGLYREVTYLRTLPAKEKEKIGIARTLSLYVLLFPGEARDNTGIKDLNDKVLNYDLNTEWMALRQKAVTEIFWQRDPIPPPKWITVGQDYKTAYILPLGKTPEDFKDDLVKLDALLVKYLTEILKKAEDQLEDDAKKLKEIKKLQKAIGKKNYKFDFLFGFASMQPSGSDKTIDVVFRLITEALKGAAVARFATKVSALKTAVAKGFGTRKAIKPPPKKQDARGLAYDNDTYLRVSWTARDIKGFVATGKGKEYQPVYVNKVWITSYLYYRERYFGSSDMIRDVRKKALEKPSMQSTARRVNTQRELFELYLVALNMLDFVAGFLSAEFYNKLVEYHDIALAAFSQLQDECSAINWDRLTKVLTRDIRLTQDRRIVLGTTSEFQFYAYSSDYAEQLFLVFDVRDLGVDLMAHYEFANVIVTDDKLKDNALVKLTLRSGDATVQRKRVTYDTVVSILKDKFKSLLSANGRAAAQAAFGTALQTSGSIPDFDNCVQVMLGGDEIFVAAHPYFAKFEAEIVTDLNKATYNDLPLNLRTAVAYSSAKRMPNPQGAKGVTDPQRSENFIAHHNALELAGESHGFLKSIERVNRRIELYIEMLESIKRKAKLAPPLAKRLADLRLTELYTRSRYSASSTSGSAYERLLRLMKSGDLKGATADRNFKLVDFSGKEVNADKLLADIAKLELDAKNAVGLHNVRIETPVMTKMPKRLEKEIDRYVDGKWPWEYDDKK